MYETVSMVDFDRNSKRYIENVRKREDLSEVYYEIGSEETSGGVTETENMERFIHLLKVQLKKTRI